MARFFETPVAFRAWLEAHAASEAALVVGFHKVGSGRPSLSWPEAVDEALCVGWIDGVRRRIDDHSYEIRFTPRKPRSIWSAVNIERVRVLDSQGRMKPPGLLACTHRTPAKSKIYSYEQAEGASLEPAETSLFKGNKAAWKFFEAQPPSYRKRMLWRIVSASRAVTRQARLDKLITACEQGLRL